MDLPYYEAAVNRPHRVLGVTLNPLCLEHAQVLEVIASPVWLGGKITWGDLISAVWVCADRRISKFTWLRVLWIRFRYRDLARAHTAFAEYVKDHYTKPKVWYKDASHRSGAPWILGVVASLIQHTSMVYRDVMRMPIGQTLWIQAAIAESMGNIEIVTLDEEAAIAALGLKI